MARELWRPIPGGGLVFPIGVTYHHREPFKLFISGSHFIFQIITDILVHLFHRDIWTIKGILNFESMTLKLCTSQDEITAGNEYLKIFDPDIKIIEYCCIFAKNTNWNVLKSGMPRREGIDGGGQPWVCLNNQITLRAGTGSDFCQELIKLKTHKNTNNT